MRCMQMIRSFGVPIQHFPSPDQCVAVAIPKFRQVVCPHRVRMRVLQQTPSGLQPRQNPSAPKSRRKQAGVPNSQRISEIDDQKSKNRRLTMRTSGYVASPILYLRHLLKNVLRGRFMRRAARALFPPAIRRASRRSCSSESVDVPSLPLAGNSSPSVILRDTLRTVDAKEAVIAGLPWSLANCGLRWCPV